MSCPHFKKLDTGSGGAGTCLAHLDRVMVPSLHEVTLFCSTENYDQCEIYLRYIESCTRMDFPKILESLSDPDSKKQ